MKGQFSEANSEAARVLHRVFRSRLLGEVLFIQFSPGHCCYRDCDHHLILKHKSFDSFKQPEEDKQDTDILDPGKLYHFPESW